MSVGIAKTLEYLTKTPNRHATVVLLPALDSPLKAVQKGALRALLKRRDLRGHREVIRRFEKLDDEARQIVFEHASRLTAALRAGVMDSDSEVATQACNVILELEEFDLVSVLIHLVEDVDHPNGELVGQVLLSLAWRLRDRLACPPEEFSVRDPRLVHSYFIRCLEQSLRRYERHRQRVILEAYLLLVNAENEFFQNVLDDPLSAVFRDVVAVLGTTTEEPIVQLLVDCFRLKRVPQAVLSVISRRTDPEFVGTFLQLLGPEPPRPMKPNLKRITKLAWAEVRREFWDKLDDVAQHAAVNFLMATSVPRTQAFEVIKYLLRQGKPGGRRAAALALEQFDGAEVASLVEQAMSDEDPYVQAAVLSQLRQRGAVDAIPQAIKMLDSPFAVVRQAARATLQEFTFERFLAAFDALEDDVRRSTGLLVRKVDPKAVDKLLHELEAPVRTRRLRALEMTEAMGLVQQLEDAVIECLKDEDHMVRATAARLLAQGRTTASYDALTEALRDRSEIVREAARESLDRRAFEVEV